MVMVGIAAAVLGILALLDVGPVLTLTLVGMLCIGGALLMAGGALFKGFLQRGLVFEPPDIEFLFTSPFTQRQIVFYRFLPNYLFALAQSLVFYALLESHLKHAVLTSACLMLFQIVCFHIAAGAAIFAGILSEQAHHRCQWILLCCYFVISALYLHTAWGLRLVPSFVTSPLTQVFFYPALTLTDLGGAPVVSEWSLLLLNSNPSSLSFVWQPIAYLLAFSLSLSLIFLLSCRAQVT